MAAVDTRYAELEAQSALVAAGVDLRADVLKVPHHGSAYSDPW